MISENMNLKGLTKSAFKGVVFHHFITSIKIKYIYEKLSLVY